MITAFHYKQAFTATLVIGNEKTSALVTSLQWVVVQRRQGVRSARKKWNACKTFLGKPG
jgi:hypothetical protein